MLIDYKQIFESCTLVILIIDPSTSQIVHANSAACNYYDYSLDELIGMDISNINCLTKEEILKVIYIIKDKKNNFFSFKHKLKNGEIRDVDVCSNTLISDEETLLYSIVVDTTEIKKMSRELIIKRAQSDYLFEEVPEAIALLDINDKIVSANKAFCSLFGFNKEDIYGLYINNLIIPDDYLGEAYKFSEAVMSGGFINTETKRKKKDGSTIDVSIFAYPIFANDKQIGIYVIYKDITEKIKIQNKLEYLAYYDSLTGLYNRSRFYEVLGNLIDKTYTDNKIHVLFLDLDDFKRINDSFGHSFGDKLLTNISKNLKNLLKDVELIARIGGDEFVIVYRDKEGVLVEDIIQRLFILLKEPIECDNNFINISASIGISVYPDDGLDIDTLMRKADIAMYSSKDKGKSNATKYNSELEKSIIIQYELENDLKNAIKYDELFLCYQPIVKIDTGKIVGAEALLRWKRRNKEFVPPNIFIPLAEKSEVIKVIGNWVFEQACIQKKKWESIGYNDFFISINASVKQFEGEEFYNAVVSNLERHSINPSSVHIEITESISKENLLQRSQTLKRIKELGINISIDDFGTGYSCFSNLKDLCVGNLKIDKSFIDNIINDKNEIEIVSAIIAMAKKLNLSIIAEGVETVNQKEVLEVIGCDMIQGYLYSPPLIADKFEEFYTNLNC